jgi:DNA-directed RNA polymerase specialized sigma24 family protein
MADNTPFPPARGDETALFRDFNAELMRTVAGAVGTSSPHVVEDAVAHAWTRFMQYQPDRSRNWRGWLFRVAQHEAWTLEAAQRDHASLDEHDRHERRSTGVLSQAHDPHVTNIEVGEAFEILDRLPERLRRVALLRALGMRHKDISELTGDSPARVGQLIFRANVRIYEVLEERARQQPDLPPRAKRLAELEERQPAWLTEEIGRPPRMRRQKPGFPELRRSWRRAALALDDLRAARVAGSVDLTLTQRAADAVSELRRQRDRYAGRDVGR